MDGFATALACFQRGDLAGAETALAAVLARTPRNPNALHLLASVRHAQGDGEAAALLFERAAAAAPQDAAIAFNRACVLAKLNRHGEAVSEFERALALHAGDGEALLMRGVSLAALARFGEALASYDAALAAGLDRPETHANRGAALAALDRHEEALAASDKALAAAPNDANALFNRGASLVALDRYEDAVRALDEAVALKPSAVARAVRSTAYANVGRFAEAMADIEAAIAAEPQRVDFRDRRGHALLMANRYDEAIAAYNSVLAANPDDADAAYAKADALLSAGDFAAGFPLYEARWRMKDAPRIESPTEAPLWLGAEDIAGKRLLVQTEQGFGDLFQFCRFIPALAARGAHVVLQERPQTLTLMKSLAGVKALIALGASAPQVDFRIPLASLMGALGVRVETLPGPMPYLFAEPNRVARWRERLGVAQKRRVGVCWSGGGRKHMQMARSLDARSLDHLLSAGVEYVSLHFGANAEAALLQRRGVPDFGNDIAEFAELAALIETLDLVISTDTGVAHLAGALGKPVWILLPFHADWRWMRERTDSPWYPSARLFRQRTFGDWSGAIEAVLGQLQ
jgi:tetratricopeptide (TPR) repeat protein